MKIIKEAIINNLEEYLQVVGATSTTMYACKKRFRIGTSNKLPPYKWQIIDTGKDIIEKFTSEDN